MNLQCKNAGAVEKGEAAPFWESPYQRFPRNENCA
jgi:hypothetical protein